MTEQNRPDASMRNWFWIANTAAQKLAMLQAQAFNDVMRSAVEDVQTLARGDNAERQALLRELPVRGWQRQLEYVIAANDIIADALGGMALAARDNAIDVTPGAEVVNKSNTSKGDDESVGETSNVVALQSPAAAAVPANLTFELYRDNAGEYRFRLNRAEGGSVLSSEGYKARSSAANGISSVQKNAANADRYVRKETAEGRHMFNLRAGNNQVIGTSSAYASADEMEADIARLTAGAASAGVVDLIDT